MFKLISYGLILFAFLLPWQTRLILNQGEVNGAPWEYGTFSVYGTEILLWIIFIFAIIVRFHEWARQTRLSNFTNLARVIRGALPISVIPVIFLVFASFSIFWSQDRSIAFRAWLTLAEGIGLFLVLVRIPLPIRHILYGFIVGMALEAGLGIYQFFTQSAFASTFLGMASHNPGALGTSVVETIGGRWLRAYGSLPHPNILAGYFVVALLLLISNFKFQISNKIQNPKSKFFLLSTFYFLLSTFSAGLFFTFSRGAWAALLVGLILNIITELQINTNITNSPSPIPSPLERGNIRNIRKNSLFGSIFVFSVFVFLSLVFWQPFSARILGQGRLETVSYVERVSSLRQAGDIIQERPLLGTGIGNYTVAIKQKDPSYAKASEGKPAFSGWDLQPPHNIYLLIWAELGLIGLLLFLIFLFYLFKLFVIRYSLLVLLPLAILGLFDHYLWSLYAGVMLFWLTCGLTVSTSRANTEG